MKNIKTLKFQIAIALLALIALFAGILSLSLNVINEQQRYNTLQTIAVKLEQTERTMISQAMAYTINTPKNEGSYRRDLMLYYQNLKAQIELFDKITMSFMREDFAPSLTDLDAAFHPDMDQSTETAITMVEEIWIEFREGLFLALGASETAPLLEEAAEYISSHHAPLTDSLTQLMEEIEQLVENRLHQAKQFYWSMLLAAILIALGIFAWFFTSVLVPLQNAVKGFNKVSQGDFGYQVPITSDNEITQLTHSFNHLSARLHTLFRLINRIQQGSDLDEALGFVAEELPRLLPLNWVGALIVAADNSTIVLERSYTDGQADTGGKRRFVLSKTLLHKALESGEPLHISDMQQTARNNSNYQFLNHLVSLGLRDAIFLPVTELSPVPVVLAFASDKADSYTPDHLEFLTNIANLITHSFGRTVKLVEHARLANIGEFASGIAHEIRSPLSTITMALDHFQHKELEERSLKRAKLAHQEARRMERLLGEMLLYAKPLALTIEVLDLPALVSELIETNQSLLKRDQSFSLTSDCKQVNICGDRDRLIQIFVNLAKNACEAAPEESAINWHISDDDPMDMVSVEITNQGDAIPMELQEKLFTPFFTTKTGGTGLGLSIVKRMVEAHGGEIDLLSEPEKKIRVKVIIPKAIDES